MDRSNSFVSLRLKRPFPALEWLTTRRTAPLHAFSTPAPISASAPPQVARPVPPPSARRGSQPAPRPITSNAAACSGGQLASPPRPLQHVRPALPNAATRRSDHPTPGARPARGLPQSAPRSLTLYDFEIRVLLSYAPEWLREIFLPRL